jgi:hypothetical protein
VAGDAPRIAQNPVVSLPTFWLGLLAREFQCFKVAGQFVMQLGWELQGEALTLSTIFCQLTCVPWVEGDNGCTMIRIVNQRHPKSNLLKVTHIPPPSQDVVWLGMMPSPHLLLMPLPSFLGHLHLALPDSKFSRGVNKIYFV